MQQVEDLAMTIHPHPTLGEIIMEAAEMATRKVKIPCTIFGLSVVSKIEQNNRHSLFI